MMECKLIFGDKDYAQCSHDRQLAEIREAEFDYLSNVIHVLHTGSVSTPSAFCLLKNFSIPCTATPMSKKFLYFVCNFNKVMAQKVSYDHIGC